MRDSKLPRRCKWDLPSSWTALSLKMGPTDCPETSVTNHQQTPHNIAEERRFLLFY